MVAIPPPLVPFAPGEDASRLRLVVDRTTKEVEDFNSHYEDQRKLDATLGTEHSKPENKPALDVLEIRERRLDVVRVREVNALSNLTNFLIADNNALHA